MSALILQLAYRTGDLTRLRTSLSFLPSVFLRGARESSWSLTHIVHLHMEKASCLNVRLRRSSMSISWHDGLWMRLAATMTKLNVGWQSSMRSGRRSAETWMSSGRYKFHGYLCAGQYSPDVAAQHVLLASVHFPHCSLLCHQCIHKLLNYLSSYLSSWLIT